MKNTEQNFDDLNALVLRKSIWGLSGHNARPFRVFFLFAFCGLALSAATFATSNTAMLPAGFLLIAVAGPLAFMAYINKKTRCLSALVPEIILSTFFIGGALALVIGGSVNMVIPALDASWSVSSETTAGVQAIKPLEAQPDVCEKARKNIIEPGKKDNTKLSKAILLVGFIEEAAKLLFPLFMLMLVPLARRNVSIGLALGTLTALGFAVLESLFYGLSQFPALNDFSYIMYYCSDVALKSIGMTDFTLFFRGLTTPFGHLAWTGTATIIIWHLVCSSKPFFIKVVAGFGIYLVVAVLHSLNDFFLENFSHVSYSHFMQAGAVATIVVSFALLYFSLRLAIYKDKPATVQVWEKLHKTQGTS